MSQDILDLPPQSWSLALRTVFGKVTSGVSAPPGLAKPRAMEHIIEQDIKKGYSVVTIDPKGNMELFSEIAELANKTGRIQK
ncbi:MAG: hypothetical protein KJ630_22510 [Proteobacteria bacterium]|nr:hypothetical protein [Pseudomonadota bacterium]